MTQKVAQWTRSRGDSATKHEH